MDKATKERIEALEKRIAELERTPREQHNHYHYNYGQPYYIPAYVPQPPSQPVPQPWRYPWTFTACAYGMQFQGSSQMTNTALTYGPEN